MKTRLQIALAIVIVLTMSSSAYPSGFAIIEQSVRGLGNSFSGGSAVCEDASTIFFNPAGIARLEGHDAVAGLHIVMLSAEFENKGSTHILQPLTDVPLLGGNGGNGGVTGYIPNFYYSYSGYKGWSFGVGVNAPFALSTKYEDRTWVGRYHALETTLMSVNINPTVAYSIPYDMVHRFSIGVGVDAQYMDATLSNAIDFGTLDASGAFSPIPAGFFGLTPQRDDGFSELKGNSWAWGFNLGVLVEFTERTRAGIAYRSQIKHDVEGTATFQTPDTLQVVKDATGAFTDCDVTASVKFPDNLSVSAYHDISDQWAISGDVTWTHWSVFEELRFKFANGQPDGVTTENWKDAWRFALGWTYRPTDEWTARAGVAYDATPIPDEQHRTPRIPGNDRYWVSVGGGYQVNDRFRADVAYAHLFISQPKIDKSRFTLAEDEIRGGLRGEYDASVDILSLQVSVQF
ncbi:MAG: outer membrane protein transport protein [bacterium]